MCERRPYGRSGCLPLPFPAGGLNGGAAARSGLLPLFLSVRVFRGFGEAPAEKLHQAVCGAAPAPAAAMPFVSR